MIGAAAQGMVSEFTILVWMIPFASCDIMRSVDGQATIR